MEAEQIEIVNEKEIFYEFSIGSDVIARNSRIGGAEAPKPGTN
jgi:hypothetical protein